MTSLLERTQKTTSQIDENLRKGIRDLVNSDSTKKARKTLTKRARVAERKIKKNTPSAKEIKEASSDLTERIIVGAGMVLPLLPPLLKKASQRRKVQVSVVTAPRMMLRSNPLFIGATIIGGVALAFYAWRKNRRNKQEAQLEKERSSVRLDVARMQDEGGNPSS